MIFKNKNKNKPELNIYAELKIEIIKTDETEFLGLKIDEGLRWSFTIFLLRNLRKCGNDNMTRNFYHSLFVSQAMYGFIRYMERKWSIKYENGTNTAKARDPFHLKPRDFCREFF